ncbi:hypothetical protein ACFLZ7_00295 [Nanoarchaeota archaeon]
MSKTKPKIIILEDSVEHPTETNNLYLGKARYNGDTIDFRISFNHDFDIKTMQFKKKWSKREYNTWLRDHEQPWDVVVPYSSTTSKYNGEICAQVAQYFRELFVKQAYGNSKL